MKENIKCEEDTNVDNAFSRNTACLGDYDLQEACFTGMYIFVVSVLPYVNSLDITS